MIELNLLIGLTGTSLILLAFLMNQINYWSNDSLIYDFINFVGSSLMSFYALTINSFPFLILNLVWALFSLKDVLKDLTNNTTSSSNTS